MAVWVLLIADWTAQSSPRAMGAWAHIFSTPAIAMAWVREEEERHLTWRWVHDGYAEATHGRHRYRLYRTTADEEVSS